MESMAAIQASGLCAYTAAQPMATLYRRSCGSAIAKPERPSAAGAALPVERRIGGPVKALQPWTVVQRLDARVGRVQDALLPQDMQARYRKISAPVYAVWSDFGDVVTWPYAGDWGKSTNLVTAAKIRTFYTQEHLRSGAFSIVGLLNTGVKQIGKLSTHYLLTGAYVDEDQVSHNVARALPLAPVEPGARLAVLSVRDDGSRYEEPLLVGEALRPEMDFTHDFLQKVDVRVGSILEIVVDSARCITIHADFGDGLHLRTNADKSILKAFHPHELVGQCLLGMVNLEPAHGNTFLLLGFDRCSDAACIPFGIDRVGDGLPPLGARWL